MRHITLILLSAFLGIGASNCTGKIKVIDDSMAAPLANDVTVVISGCGHQPIVGYTHCRVMEGPIEGQIVTIHGPASECQRDNCVFWEIFLPDGMPSMSGAFNKKETRVSIPWKDIVKGNDFLAEQRGFYGVRLKWYWVGADGRERFSFADGEIRLRVLKKEYTPLHDSKESPFFAWSWVDDAGMYHMTTSGRAHFRSK